MAALPDASEEDGELNAATVWSYTTRTSHQRIGNDWAPVASGAPADNGGSRAQELVFWAASIYAGGPEPMRNPAGLWTYVGHYVSGKLRGSTISLPIGEGRVWTYINDRMPRVNAPRIDLLEHISKGGGWLAKPNGWVVVHLGRAGWSLSDRQRRQLAEDGGEVHAPDRDAEWFEPKGTRAEIRNGGLQTRNKALPLARYRYPTGQRLGSDFDRAAREVARWVEAQGLVAGASPELMGPAPPKVEAQAEGGDGGGVVLEGGVRSWVEVDLRTWGKVLGCATVAEVTAESDSMDLDGGAGFDGGSDVVVASFAGRSVSLL